MKLARSLGAALVLLAVPGIVLAATLLVPSQYPTIQAAVAAAAGVGDVIEVGPGVYEEQVVITKNLTLSGAGVGQTVLLAPATMAFTVLPLQYNAVVHVEPAGSGTVLRGFSIDGAGRGRSGTRFAGVVFNRAGGTVENIAIADVHDTPVTSATSGIGFYSHSESGDQNTLLVDGLEIRRFQKTGFACFGSGCVPELRNILVDPDGIYSDSVQNGFELLNSSSGSLANCTARGLWYDGAPIGSTTACGFLFYYAEDWTFDGLDADANQAGIYNIFTSVQGSNSTVTGYPGLLDFNYGVVVSGPASSLEVGTGLPLPLPLAGAERTLVSALGTVTTFDNCKLQGSKLPGSLGLAVASSLDETALAVDNCMITDWEVGLLVAEGSGGWVAGRARTTLFAGNTAYGLLASTYHPFDARGCYWDDPSGPFHAVSNPAGTGDRVSDSVFFDPWLQGNVVCAPLPQYISQADADGAGYAKEITVRYLGGGTEPVYGYSVELSWNQGKLTASVNDVTRPDNGVFAAASLFQVLPLAGGLRIEAALGGSQPGIAAGELFKVRFHLIGEPDYTEVPLDLTVRHLRDNQNHDISGYIADGGLVIGDVQAPVIADLKLTNATLSHTDAFAKNGDLVEISAAVSDGDPLFDATRLVGNFLFVVGAPGYLQSPNSYAAGLATWPALPAQLFPLDGPVGFSVTAVDLAGNVATVAGSVTADNTPPAAVAGLEAVSGHNRIDLQWNEPAGLDTNLQRVSVRAARTNDYPFYTEPLAAYPESPLDGNPVYTGLGTTAAVSYAADGSERDIVSFQAFAEDIVGLVSPAAPSSQDRALNYFLADVTGATGYDQVTDIFDVSRLGDTFGVPGGQAGFDGECDVGPTDDGTSGGLPLPDGAVDIDDLMIFADRFDAFLHPPVTAAKDVAAVELRWAHPAAELWILELAAPCPELKGLRLTGAGGGGTAVSVVAGDLLRSQSAPYFLHAAANGLDATFAMLGAGVGIDGTGELLRVTTALPVGETAITWDARGVGNSSLPVAAAASAVAAELPAVFALHGNHPNPFNPVTVVAFDLPSPQRATLVIYGVDGRRVAQVLDAVLPAGRHEVVWRGCDDRQRAVATGLYLYRLEAGPFAASGKMNLVR